MNNLTIVVVFILLLYLVSSEKNVYNSIITDKSLQAILLIIAIYLLLSSSLSTELLVYGTVVLIVVILLLRNGEYFSRLGIMEHFDFDKEGDDRSSATSKDTVDSETTEGFSDSDESVPEYPILEKEEDKPKSTERSDKELKDLLKELDEKLAKI